MAAKNPTIPIRNLDYIRRNPHTQPLKGHLVAEAFDDVSSTVGQLQAQIKALQETVAKLAKP